MTALAQLRPRRRLAGAAERLLRLELGDPCHVQLAIGGYSATLRAIAAVTCGFAGLPRLALISSLGALFHAMLVSQRHRPRHLHFFIFASGVEWLLWAITHFVTFGFACSFQLYPLLLLSMFPLLFHGLGPGMRLSLLVTPLVIYAPITWLLWSIEPIVQLSSNVQQSLSLVNEIVVAASVVVIAGAALLEHVRARRVAEHREAAQAQLVEDLSHELRTPLATLLTLAQGAQAPGQSVERVGERLGWIEESAREAGRLVQRLLDLAALDHGRETPGTTAPLSEVVRGAVKGAQAVAVVRGVTVDFEERDPCEMLIDVASLEVVLRNLLANAISHSPDNGWVEVRVQSNAEGVRIEVEDQGEGIAEEHLPLIFDRLWRADPARSRSEGRFGLGLSIAKRHAELLGAKITVRSQLGVGTVFSLVL